MSTTVTLTDTTMNPHNLHGHGSNHLQPEGATGDLNAKPVTKQNDKPGFFANLFSRKKPETPQTVPSLKAALDAADADGEYNPMQDDIDNEPSSVRREKAVVPQTTHWVTLSKVVTGRTDRTKGTVSPTYAKINRVLDRLTNAETNGASNRLQIPGTKNFLLREFEIEQTIVQTILKFLNVLKSGSEYFVADGKAGIITTAILTAIAGLVRGTIFIAMRATTAVATLIGTILALAALAVGGMLMLIGLALKHVVYPVMKFLVKIALLILLLPLDIILVPIQKAGEKNGRTFIEKTPFQRLVGSLLPDSNAKADSANKIRKKLKVIVDNDHQKSSPSTSQGSPTTTREESRPDSPSRIQIELNDDHNLAS